MFHMCRQFTAKIILIIHLSFDDFVQGRATKSDKQKFIRFRFPKSRFNRFILKYFIIPGLIK